MKLVIVSHTEHYTLADGKLVGWGPTVAEINHLATHFTEIIHLAFLYEEKAPESALAYTEPNIRFVPLPKQGGKNVLSKFSLIRSLPKTVLTVRNYLNEVDVFQFRTPTGMGVYLIPYFTFFVKKHGWFKYAGNWNQKHPPFGYRLQRWMLKKQRRIVTINGKWPRQPRHCLTFENPCLSEAERKSGITHIKSKNYKAPYTFLFVGRLEDEKGVQRILEAFAGIGKNMYTTLHMVGDGPKRKKYEDYACSHGINAKFYGFLGREAVFELYEKSDFLLLPSSASEGFPKVIAEAMNYGCLPMVSSVSSIGQYVNYKNGYLLEPNTSEKLKEVIESVRDTSKNVLVSKAENAHETASRFTFSLYIERIALEICSPKKIKSESL